MRAIAAVLACLLLALGTGAGLARAQAAQHGAPGAAAGAEAGAEAVDLQDLGDPQPILKTLPELPPVAKTREQLKTILAQPEYQGQQVQQGPSLWNRILAWLQRVFGGMALGGGIVSVVLIALVALLLAYIIFRMLWELQFIRSRKAKAQHEEHEEPQSAAGLLSAAAEAAARGDYRQAVRLRFRALLTALELPSAALLTNWQVLRQVGREHPQALGPFRELVQCFEDAWYGGLEAGPGDYAQAGALAERVLAAVAEAQA